MKLKKGSYYFNEKDGKIYMYLGMDTITGVLIMAEVYKHDLYKSPRSDVVKFQQETEQFFKPYEGYTYKLLKLLE